ncbi:TonB-dependent receptor [Sphingobium subterraneum]|uniref:Iron complex outermembrane receptor protein n=1 Tax=Sphingobium subterraneum TaxID=627688 RepID=A0A841J5S8_9SPHN|nr:TonB-dependent receptor [Sphingobium subterraneum]MBB6124876.1 iron complex outermembrane receptor protein [Sphingobium subterraneum]
MNIHKNMLLMTATSCLALLSFEANAQTSAPTAPQNADSTSVSSDDGGEILVTARRENENLRDTPATVAVLTARTLEQTGAKVAVDFVKLTSGVSIATGTTEPGDTSIQIRGLNGARDAENNVALVIDGVLKTNASALNQPQGALSQVEILKGPQGAIYGRNASAGAIVITTRKPTDKLEIEGKAHAATDNTYGGSLLIAGPITENVGFVLSGDYDQSDGYFRNEFLGTALARSVYPTYKDVNQRASIDNYKMGNVYGRLVLRPSDATEIDIKAHAGYNKGGAITFNAVFQLPTLATAFNDQVFNIKASDHKFIFTNNTAAHSWQKTWDASFRLSQDLDFAKLIATIGYSHIQNDFYAGGTSGAFGFFANEPTCQSSRAATAPPGVINQEPFNTYYGAFGFAQPYSPSTCDGIQYQKRTQNDVVSELRLVGDAGALSWQLGGSYIFIDRRTCISLQIDPGTGGVRSCYVTDPVHHTESLQDDNYRTNVYAAFGSLEYEVNSQLKLGAALRYDIEARKTSNNVPVAARTLYQGNPRTGFPVGTPATPANYFLNPGLDPAYNPSGVLAPRSKTFKQWEPKLTASYKLSPTATIFGDWGIGFKAGGFNSGGSKAIVDGFFNPAPPTGISAGVTVNDDYKKETTSAFELGIKGRAMNMIDYELVGYYTNVKNMQFFEFFVGDFGQLRVISNIDKVRIWGLESSLNVRLMKGLSVFGTANYTDSKIKKNSSRPYTVGNKSPATPDFTLNFGTQVSMPLNDALTFNFRADARMVGPTPFHTVQDNTVPTIFALPANYKNSTRATYTTVNVRAGIETDHWSLSAYATNLFNQRSIEEAVVAPEFGGDFVAPSPLRRYGVEASFKF